MICTDTTPDVTTTAPDLTAATLAALDAGLSVLPIDCRTKKPFNRLLPQDEKGKPVWEPFKRQPPDRDTVRGWFANGARAFAVVAGAVSGGLLVLDFDVERFYDAWSAAVGGLAHGMPVQRTGGGGSGLLPLPGAGGEHEAGLGGIRVGGVRPEVRHRDAGRGRVRRGPAEPPPQRRAYAWLRGNLSSIPSIPQAHADALIAAARKLDECPFTRTEKERIERDARLAHQRRAAAERNGTTSVIYQFNAAHRIEEVLGRHGYTPCGDRFVRPGGQSASVSVRDGRSCHLSTSDPLNDGKVRSGIGVHDAFDVYAHLEHGGDVKAAVKAAARDLGIQPSRPSGGTAHDGGAWSPDPHDVVELPEPMRLTEHYLARRRTTAGGQLTLRRYREQWWSFERGGYRPLPDEVALVDLYRHVDGVWTPVRDRKTGQPTGDFRKLVARSSTVSELAKAIRACGAIVDGEMPQWLDGRASPAPCDVVAFRNGILDAAAWCRGEAAALLLLTPTAWFACSAATARKSGT